MEFICGILDSKYRLEDKADALNFFQTLRQLMRSWNSAEFMGLEFKKIEEQIRKKLEERKSDKEI